MRPDPSAIATSEQPEAKSVAPMPRDDRRLRAMVDSHWHVVGRLLRHLGVPPSDLDDALQTVFMVAAQKLEVIRPDAERSFLMQTGAHVAARSRRARAISSSREVLTGAEDETVDERGPDRALEQSEALRSLHSALDRMDDDVREVFVLYEIEELTMAKIAELLGVPAGTVASRLRRGREVFQRSLDEEEK